MRYLKTTMLFLILAEIFSFCGFLYPFFNKACFLAILAIALIISLKKFENGIYILLAELFAGSFGYLFFYDFHGTAISLRIGLFLVIISVWLAKMVSGKERHEAIRLLKKNKFVKYYLFLFVFFIWGVIWGILRNNGIGNVFFDANAYIYFGLIFPFITTIRNVEQIKNIFHIMLAAVIVVSLKTLFLLFLFSHKMYYAMEFLYKWVRDYRFAEITAMPQGFYRIFSQTHIYVLIVLFLIVIILLREKEKKSKEDMVKKSIILFLRKISRQNDIGIVMLYVIFLSVIAVDLSRSFWVSGFITVFFMYLILILVMKMPWKKLLRFTFILFLGSIIAFGLIALIVKFPYPKESVDFSADLLSDRATSVSGEQGASSRWNLLPALALAITKHPFIGSGFGSTVTYKSNDPRVLESSPGGKYTTYAFEWGYLDIILKIGVLGIFFYLVLIWKIWQEGWRALVRSSKEKDEKMMFFTASFVLGIIIILTTSIFSPYMNHPLGIGYVMLCSAALSAISDSNSFSHR